MGTIEEDEEEAENIAYMTETFHVWLTSKGEEARAAIALLRTQGIYVADRRTDDVLCESVVVSPSQLQLRAGNVQIELTPNGGGTILIDGHPINRVTNLMLRCDWDRAALPTLTLTTIVDPRVRK